MTRSPALCLSARRAPSRSAARIRALAERAQHRYGAAILVGLIAGLVIAAAWGVAP